MDPVIVSFGSFSLRWYGVMAALGFLTALLLMQINRRYAKLKTDQISNICIIAMICGIIGARIFYVLLKWKEHYRYRPQDIIRIDQGGLVFYGGFILAALVLIYYIRKVCKADFIRVLDVVAPALAAAHALGRIGCFFNGCCYGKPTDMPWGVVYKLGTEPFKRYQSMPLHPVQLYETILNLLLAGILFYLVRKGRRGMAMSCYILAYGILRFVDEFFRGDHPKKELVFNILTPAQTIGLIMIPLGIFLLIYFIRKEQAQLKTDEETE
jgi:phosphatidylglycerol:prolipoprotein diacylglycerol transferase